MTRFYSSDTPLCVQIVLFDGFDLLDAIAPYEVFLAAAQLSNGALKVNLVTAEGPRSVTSGLCFLSIPADGTLSPEEADIIVIPGAAGNPHGDGKDTAPFLLNQAANTELVPLMKRAFDLPETIVASVCGGSLLLAMAGLLGKRNAVTHHFGMTMLSTLGAFPVNARVVDDGNFVSSGGVTSGLDLALYLVDRMLGSQIALSIEVLFEYERRGTVWNARGMTPMSWHPASDVDQQHGIADVQNPKAVSSEGRGFLGDWDVEISTPIGVMKVMLSILIVDGLLQGTATQEGETTQLDSVWINGDQLCWSQALKKPLKITLDFAVRTSLNTMSGTAKAGSLPASRLTGSKVG
ncbi:DJ-1/PfpI family protein [Pseudomonas sp. AM8]|uniref:DJ-1/PfpI family protein n=1 Tax=Pseudomonas sp. AM8 TaxID=2983368 RepID=UPI002E809172|nr:DJ-1/PfpI family protein [Pseudomonas sp. AM8]